MILEYLWIDEKQHLRSKCRTVDEFLLDFDQPTEEFVKQLPYWNFDGSSTGQATRELSEITLIPVNYIRQPFFKKGLLVLCECYTLENKPAPGNTRCEAQRLFSKQDDLKIWFGLEQEFFFFNKETKAPIGWNGLTQTPQGDYYCGINKCNPLERRIINELYTISLNSGLSMSGINQEVAPSQWEYQIGPVEGIYAADQMIFAKFILYRLCEQHNLYAVFHPKPLKGDWNGSGCHINISTQKTRTTNNGMDEIYRIIQNMHKDHSEFISEYSGLNNHLRLTGDHETSDPNIFSFSIGGRGTSIRIPYETNRNGYGYFEDRRPGSALDYYKTLGKYVEYCT